MVYDPYARIVDDIENDAEAHIDIDEFRPLDNYFSKGDSLQAGSVTDDQAESNPVDQAFRARHFGEPLHPVASASFQPSQGLCVRAAPNGSNLVAVGRRDGTVAVYKGARPTFTRDHETAHLVHLYSLGTPARVSYGHIAAAHAPSVSYAQSSGAVTALTWRHDSDGRSNMLLAARAGALCAYHVTSGTLVSSHALKDSTSSSSDNDDDDDTFLALSTSAEGAVAAGHATGAVSIWDSRGAELRSVLRFGASENAKNHLDSSVGHGHTNRVFSVAWDRVHSCILYSGGWDQTVQMWDTRVQRSIRSIHGADICGDGLAPEHSGTLVTASWRAKHPLQRWDTGSGRLVSNLPVHARDGHALNLYCAAALADGRVIAGGMASVHGLRVLSPEGETLNAIDTSSAVHDVDVVDGSDARQSTKAYLCCADSVTAIRL